MMNNVSDMVYEKHSGLDHYDGKMIRIVDRWEQSFTGTAIHFNRDYMFHAFPVYPVCRESREAYRDILVYLRR